MMQHARKLETCKDLQRLMRVLVNAARNGTWLTTLDLTKATRLLNVSTLVSELRANGFLIKCDREMNTLNSPKMIYYYQLPIWNTPSHRKVKGYCGCGVYRMDKTGSYKEFVAIEDLPIWGDK